MARGHPDYQTQSGRNVGGESIDSFSFSGAITSGSSGTVDVGEIATGKQKFYQALIISVPDDAFIHTVELTRISDSFIWWSQEFVTAGSFEVPGFAFSEGEEVRITITNNGDATLTFTGQIFSTQRDVS